MHVLPCGQALPHVPQLFGSVCVSVQAPLQTVPPPGQPHLPLLQAP
jgi:hypothetical protein